MDLCDVNWNSHGCGLARGHSGDVHVCLPYCDDGPCSRIHRVDGVWTREDLDLLTRSWETVGKVEPYGNDVP